LSGETQAAIAKSFGYSGAYQIGYVIHEFCREYMTYDEVVNWHTKSGKDWAEIALRRWSGMDAQPPDNLPEILALARELAADLP
jgi:hypothetical protein